MYFETQDKTYATLRNLSFTPEIDLTGQQFIINEFTVEIETDDNIDSGQCVRLIDDQDRLWVRYWACKVKRKDAKIVMLNAKSRLFFLERYTMYRKLYENVRLDTAITEIFNKVDDAYIAHGYDNTEMRSMKINGYCPTHNARERLQSILMATGTYYDEFGRTGIRLMNAPQLGVSITDEDLGTVLKANSVFMKPSLIENDPVSRLYFTSYSVTDYEPADPGAKTFQDEDGKTYWYTTSGFVSRGPGVGNEITVDGNMIVDYTSQQIIGDNIIAYYMTPGMNRVEADVINNGTIWPGMRVLLPFDIEKKQMVMGYVAGVEFSFGNQIRSKLSIQPALVFDAAKVTLEYNCDGETVHTETVLYPIGRLVEIYEGQIQVLTNGHLRTYEHIYISGEATRDGVIEIPCDLISDQNLITGEMTYPTSGEVTEE